MTNTPDLTPEAVERLAKSLAFVANRTGMTVEKCEQITDDTAATLRALSAALEVAEMSAKHWHARAEAAEAERDEALNQLDSERHNVDVLEIRVDALKAELAVDALQMLLQVQDGLPMTGTDATLRSDRARAFLAARQKEADT